jgi:hypothetical protein
MFKRMVLKRIKDQVQRLENAMKKAKHRVGIAELGEGCLID